MTDQDVNRSRKKKKKTFSNKRQLLLLVREAGLSGPNVTSSRDSERDGKS